MLKYASMLLTVLFSAAACREAHVAREPDKESLAGSWIPDRRHSNCPPSWMGKDSALILKAGGECEAREFGKSLFARNYAAAENDPAVPVVTGRWALQGEKGKWKVTVDWNLASQPVQTEANVTSNGTEMRLEFWTGYPDTHPRLLLQQSSPSQ